MESRGGITQPDSPRCDPEGFATDTERLFDEYLHFRRLSHDYEPELAGAHPDFRVHHPKGTVICEAIEVAPELRWSRCGAERSPALRIRKALDRKRRQGRGAKGKFPYVLVLGAGNRFPPRLESKIAMVKSADPGAEPFPLHANLAPVFIAEALLGDLTVKIPIHFKDGEQVGSGPARQELDRNGKLRPTQNTRFSAVAVPAALNPGWKLVEREVSRRRVPGMTSHEYLDLVNSRDRGLLQAGRAGGAREGLSQPVAGNAVALRVLLRPLRPAVGRSLP